MSDPDDGLQASCARRLSQHRLKTPQEIGDSSDDFDLDEAAGWITDFLDPA